MVGIEYEFFDFVVLQGYFELRFCFGLNCVVIVRFKELKLKKVECSYCKITFW